MKKKIYQLVQMSILLLLSSTKSISAHRDKREEALDFFEERLVQLRDFPDIYISPERVKKIKNEFAQSSHNIAAILGLYERINAFRILRAAHKKNLKTPQRKLVRYAKKLLAHRTINHAL